jgi:hypothetical protein
MWSDRITVRARPQRLRVALVTCRELPDADADSRELIEPLAELGVDAPPAVWDDSSANGHRFDLVVVRSAWDYALRRPAFLEWARRTPGVCNPDDVLAWNTDKHYLRDLASAGIPTVPTTWVDPDSRWTPAVGSAEVVIKPAVSLASLDTGRYRLGDSVDRRLAVDHVRRLQRAGRHVMVQPYASAIDAEGETSLVYFGGRFSHAIRKGAMLDGPDRGIDRRFIAGGGARLCPCEATLAQRALAERVLDAVPGGRSRLLYARVDLVSDDDGTPRLMELELAEPQLFLRLVAGAAERFARLIALRARHARVSRTQSRPGTAPGDTATPLQGPNPADVSSGRS